MNEMFRNNRNLNSIEEEKICKKIVDKLYELYPDKSNEKENLNETSLDKKSKKYYKIEFNNDINLIKGKCRYFLRSSKIKNGLKS